jgi:hypothetical protein
MAASLLRAADACYLGLSPASISDQDPVQADVTKLWWELAAQVPPDVVAANNTDPYSRSAPTEITVRFSGCWHFNSQSASSPSDRSSCVHRHPGRHGQASPKRSCGDHIGKDLVPWCAPQRHPPPQAIRALSAAGIPHRRHDRPMIPG